MDFSWSEDEDTLYESLVKFCRARLADDMLKADKTEHFSFEKWNALADFGLMKAIIPRAYCGLGLSPLTCARLMTGAGFGCKDNGLFLAMGAHMWAVEIPIIKFGSEQQKKKWLPVLGSGKCIGAHAISEPNSGSDILNLETTARKDGQDYILNGRKTFVTNAPVAELFLVFATINKSLSFTGTTAFLVEKKTPGLHVETKISKMGMRTAQMAEIIFEDCRIPSGNLLGREKQGHKIFTTGMMWERALILAPFIGAIERAIEECRHYSSERKQFGKPIAKFQEIRNKIVDMQISLESARLLLYKAAWLLEKGDARMLSSIVKLAISEAAVQTYQKVLQIFGGYGYMTESEIERHLRDSFATKLYSGTTEMQKEIIANCIGL